jgi:hypothetical protein
MEGRERQLEAGGMLRAMFPFVNDEWHQRDRRRGVPQPISASPAEFISNLAELVNAVGVEAAASRPTEALWVARQAEASSIASSTLDSLEQAVDRLCRDYPTASPLALTPRDRNKTLTGLAGAEPVAGAQHREVQRLQ